MLFLEAMTELLTRVKLHLKWIALAVIPRGSVKNIS
jgi:hypothetical protein